ALVQPMRNCPFEPWWRKTAGAAQKFLTRPFPKVGDAKILATSGTKQSRLCGKVVPAGQANGKAAKAREPIAADAAIGRKNHGSHTVHRTSEHANHGSPSRGLT